MTKKHTSTIKKGSGSADHADQPEHKEIDILVDRFLEHKSIIKGFMAYYEDIARLEAFTATELGKIGTHLPFPLREGNQFLAEGGWQTVLCNTRERTKAISDHHNALAHSIKVSTLHSLNKIKSDIKEFIVELGAKPTNLATEVGKSRAESSRINTQLSQSIALSSINPAALLPHDDPVLLHRQVEEKLKDQINLENSLTHMISEYQKKALELEKRVNIDIQAVTKDYESTRLNTQKSTNHEWQTIHTGITGINPELEWNEFAKRCDHLIPDDFPMRQHDKITFPGHNEEVTKPINVGLLERKKRFTRNYKEGYYVLTPSGYLHEFPKSSDLSKHPEPEMSIFLPHCTLGAPAPPQAKTFKWHMEESKHANAGQNVGSLSKIKKSLHIGRAEIAFSFKCRTHAEMMRWWDFLQPIAQNSNTLTAKSSETSSEHPRETITRRDGSATEEEAGGSSEEEESPLSPDDTSLGPATPAVNQVFSSALASPAKGSMVDLPVYQDKHPMNQLEQLKGEKH